MAIAIKCPACGRGYKLKDELAGKRVKCQCGQPIIVPRPAEVAKSADAAYAVGETVQSAVTSMIDEEIAAAAKKAAAETTPGLRDAEALAAVEERRAIKRGQWTRKQKNLFAGIGVAAGCLVAAVVVYLVVAAALKPGYSTPEDAFRANREAVAKRNWRAEFLTLDPESQDRVVGATAWSGVYMAAESPKVAAVLKKHGLGEAVDAVKAEQEAARESLKKYEEQAMNPVAAAAMTDATASADEDASSEEDESEDEDLPIGGMFADIDAKQRQYAAAIGDKTAFYTEMVEALDEEFKASLPENAVLRMMALDPRNDLLRALAQADLSDVKIDGDKAQGKMTVVLGGERVDSPAMFKRIDGRWLVHLPEAGDLSDYENVGPFTGGLLTHF